MSADVLYAIAVGSVAIALGSFYLLFFYMYILVYKAFNEFNK